MKTTPSNSPLPEVWPAWLRVAIRAAKEAGDAIMEIYGREFAVELKADQSPLTEADRASHDCIVKHLRATGVPVVSEEDEDAPYEVRRAWPMHWLVDPLDGTKEFVKRNGDFTVNIALIVDGHPMMGVVLTPVTGEFFAGVVGVGAYKATGDIAPDVLDRLPVFEPPFVKLPPPSAARAEGGPVRMVMSKSHLNPETLAFVERWKKEGVGVEAISRGSSMKLCLIAAGEAEVYPRLGPTMEWDTAAAQAVVEAAGGRVVHFDDALQARYEAEGSRAFGDAGPLTYNKANRLNPFFVALRGP